VRLSDCAWSPRSRLDGVASLGDRRLVVGTPLSLFTGATIALVLALIVAGCGGASGDHTNIIGQHDMTQSELDQLKSDQKDSGEKARPTDQAELDVAAKPPPPEKRAPRPRKMDAPPPVTKRGKIPLPQASSSPTAKE
jgi:hypothetical protein